MRTLLLITASLFITTIHAQTTWYEIPTGVDNKLNTIDFPTSSVGYIGGNDTLLLKTTDGGNTWAPIDFDGVTVFIGGEHILDLNFVDANTGYMTVGPYGGTFKTTDGGFNWESITASINLCYVQANYFFTEGNGYIGGSGCFEGELIDLVSADITTASIMNDNGLGAGPAELITQIDFLNEDYGLASSSGGRIFRTTDGGANWDSIPSSLGSTPITSIKIIDPLLAYAGYDADGGGYGLLKSTDAGLTWAEDIETATFYYPAYYEIIKPNADHIYVATAPAFGGGGVIFKNDGEFWNYSDVYHPVYAMDSYSDSVVWAVGDSGYVVVNIPPSTLNITDDTPIVEFNVYPNPFNSTIIINKAEFNNTHMTIIDVQGRIIEQRFIYSSEQNLSHLVDGVYLLTLVDGENEQTIRILKN